MPDNETGVLDNFSPYKLQLFVEVRALYSEGSHLNRYIKSLKSAQPADHGFFTPTSMSLEKMQQFPKDVLDSNHGMQVINRDPLY